MTDYKILSILEYTAVPVPFNLSLLHKLQFIPIFIIMYALDLCLLSMMHILLHDTQLLVICMCSLDNKTPKVR